MHLTRLLITVKENILVVMCTTIQRNHSILWLNEPNRAFFIFGVESIFSDISMKSVSDGIIVFPH